MKTIFKVVLGFFGWMSRNCRCATTDTGVFMRIFYAFLCSSVVLSSNSWAIKVDGSSSYAYCDLSETAITECADKHRQRTADEIKRLCVGEIKTYIEKYLQNSCSMWDRSIPPNEGRRWSVSEAVSLLIERGINKQERENREKQEQARKQRELQRQVDQTFNDLQVVLPPSGKSH